MMLFGGNIKWLDRPGPGPVYLAAIILAIFSSLNTLEAATAGRKPAQPISQPSPAGKSSSKPMDPAFATAGRTPGVEIWRIQDFKPVAYPKGDYGKFYTGDSYVVLSTVEKNKVKSWNIHFWLGTETSQDESGAAAIYSVQLDDQLGGTPIQYREVQEHESQAFLSLFKSGVRYLPGGVSSGFNHVDRNKHETKLYQVKGKRNIRVKQVDLAISSMNKGDCFILDAGNVIYVYVGTKSKNIEKLKAISAANLIKNQDHGGRPKVITVDAYSPESDFNDFFASLGKGSAKDVPDESTGGDDEKFESSDEKAVTLYKVSDASGTVKFDAIATKPIRQNMLDTNDCFILDTAGANIYVWVGKKSNSKEKAEAMKKAEEFLKQKHYPSWTQIQRVIENGEPAGFQEYFRTWKMPSELHTRLIRSVSKKSKIEQKSDGELPDFMPDDLTGKIEIFVISKLLLNPLEKENYGKFYGDKTYLISYEYGKNLIIYIWKGNQSSVEENPMSCFYTYAREQKLGNKAVLINVVQDNEPKHFLKMFKGKLVTFISSKEESNDRKMFRIRGTTEDNVRGSEQIVAANSLASDDVFIVQHGKEAWIWMGKDCDKVERQFGRGFAKLLLPKASIVEIEEGDEPGEFWKTLGGKDKYSESFENDRADPIETQLYHATVTNNLLVLEEVIDFKQNDLYDDEVMVLFNDTAVYLWLGKNVDDAEKRTILLAVYKKLDIRHRNYTIFVIYQNNEPSTFKSLFPKWE